MRIHYSVIEHSGNDISFDDSQYNIDCELYWDEEDAEFAAQACAEDYHSNHDGWESNWPLTFRLWDKTGKHLGDFGVDRDVEPVFFARKVVS